MILNIAKMEYYDSPLVTRVAYLQLDPLKASPIATGAPASITCPALHHPQTRE